MAASSSAIASVMSCDGFPEKAGVAVGVLTSRFYSVRVVKTQQCQPGSAFRDFRLDREPGCAGRGFRMIDLLIDHSSI